MQLHLCVRGWSVAFVGEKMGGRVRIGDRLGVKAEAEGTERKGGRVGMGCRLEGKAAVE